MIFLEGSVYMDMCIDSHVFQSWTVTFSECICVLISIGCSIGFCVLTSIL
jgi:hypothetical protein